MLAETDDHCKPWPRARPRLSGRVLGARWRLKGDDGLARIAQWETLSAGESRQISGNTVLHVLGPAGRISSFWFDEAGQVEGPMWLSRFAPPDAGALRSAPSATGWWRPAGGSCLAMAGLVVILGLSVGFRDLAAHPEVVGVLLGGWLLTFAWCLRHLDRPHRAARKEVRIPPPRARLSDTPPGGAGGPTG